MIYFYVFYGKDIVFRVMYGFCFGGNLFISDFLIGRVDRWGDEDDWDYFVLFDLFDEEFFGMGEWGVFYVLNFMDVSVVYGCVGGWGMLGGWVFFCGVYVNI